MSLSKTLGGFVFLLYVSHWTPLAAAITPGDANNDSLVDISDVVAIFEWLSLSESTNLCMSAADVNQDGRIEYLDAIYILGHMYGNSDGQANPLPTETLDSCVSVPVGFTVVDESVTVITPVSAMVSWLTALPADSSVHYGTDQDLSQSASVDESVYYHQVLLEDLKPGQIYSYRVESETASGERATSPVYAFRTLAVESYEIRADHPRIFFNQEDLARIRKDIREGGVHRENWDMLRRWTETSLDVPLEELATSDSYVEKVAGFAFVGLAGNNEACRDKAIQTALYLRGIQLSEDEKDRRGLTEVLALVYDWLYEYLSEADKEALRVTLVKQCLNLRSDIRDDEYVTGLSHGHTKSLFLGALALHGDYSRSAEFIEETVNGYRYGFLATWRRFAGRDGGSSKGWWYSGYVLPFELEFFAAWRSATGQDWFRDEAPWLNAVLDWFVYGLRGDQSFLREGDAGALGAKGLTHDNRYFANMLAKEYGNPLAQWFSEQVSAVTPAWGPHGVQEILWADPALEAAGPGRFDYPTSKLFRDAGVAIIRESWDLDSALASFRSPEAYTQGHTHRDSCSFTIFNKSSLAIDSGIYDHFGTSHHNNYYSRTIAHNSITVFDPDEVFRQYDEVFANDGGQRWLGPPEVERSLPRTPEETVDRAAGYRLGGILRYEEGEEYTYVVGDGGPSYSPKKMKKFHRHFLWLNKVAGWSRPVILVFDDVVATRDSFHKAYHLHMEEEPQIAGRRALVRHGEGTLYQWTVLPKKADLTLIGGRGKEFWVNGENYPPERGPKDSEEPGAWRLEVSPVAMEAAQRFLHALYIADGDAAPPVEPVSLSAGQLEGCVIGDYSILFNAGGPLETLEYASGRGGTSHLIFGAVPLAQYDLYVSDVLFKSVEASFAGTISFKVPIPAIIRVVRAP